MDTDSVCIAVFHSSRLSDSRVDDNSVLRERRPARDSSTRTAQVTNTSPPGSGPQPGGPNGGGSSSNTNGIAIGAGVGTGVGVLVVGLLAWTIWVCRRRSKRKLAADQAAWLAEREGQDPQ
ncbi:Hypothetical protein D9617_6g093620 [Elsinoe fawcettii]|nr:Hypothetical protein D9617_6g093620 [Elsinoe fawcettii]